MSPSPTGSPDTDFPKWDPRIIGLVGVICSIFLLFSYYKIVERNCRNRDRDRRRRLGLNDELEELSSQFDSRGLDSYVMHALPITQIKKKGSDWECAVCLGEFEAGEWVKHLPICSHVFHVSCIDTWFQTHSSCPLCRSSLCLQTLTREDYRILNIQVTVDDHH